MDLSSDASPSLGTNGDSIGTLALDLYFCESGRLSLVLFFIATGAAARTAITHLGKTSILSGLLIGVYLWGAFKWVDVQSSTQLHSLWYTIHEKALANEIRRVPEANGFIYLEGEWALQSAFMAGATNHRSVWGTAHDSAEKLEQAAIQYNSSRVVLPPPREINAIAMLIRVGVSDVLHVRVLRLK